jgi:hypothetical protein
MNEYLTEAADTIGDETVEAVDTLFDNRCRPKGVWKLNMKHFLNRDPESIMLVNGVFVAEKYRSQGLGEEVMLNMSRQVGFDSKIGASVVVLEPTRDTLDFFRKCQFQRCAAEGRQSKYMFLEPSESCDYLYHALITQKSNSLHYEHGYWDESDSEDE